MTTHRIQMACGGWLGGGGRAWKYSKCCRTVRVCVCGLCLKWPCASSSLEGSWSCVESRPVSSLCSCCSVMLLALNTQTHSSMLTAGTSSPLDVHVRLVKKKNVFVFVSAFGFKESSSPKKFLGANKSSRSPKSTQRWCNIQSLILLVYTTLKKRSLLSRKRLRSVCVNEVSVCLQPDCLQRNRSPRRLCRWLTWCAAASWLKHFLKYTFKQIPLGINYYGYQRKKKPSKWPWIV